MAVPLIYVDRSTAEDREVFEDTDQELQDLVRLENAMGFFLWSC